MVVNVKGKFEKTRHKKIIVESKNYILNGERSTRDNMIELYLNQDNNTECTNEHKTQVAGDCIGSKIINLKQNFKTHNTQGIIIHFHLFYCLHTQN